jgi:phytoene synthase
VHALYGFARYADEIVDDLASTLSDEEKRVALEQWSAQILSDLEAGVSHDHIGAALIDTVNKFAIDRSYFTAFLHSMAMDLTKSQYANFDELMEYVYGSANVIGLQMLPILGTADGSPITQEIREAAEKLGTAFQLANFIRDIGEDLERKRIYIPLDELAQFGVTPEMLYAATLTPEIKEAIKFQIERVRRLQRESQAGIARLHPSSRACIEAASELYCGIVDEVEKIDYDVFTKRAKTSTWRRIKVSLPAFVRAIANR